MKIALIEADTSPAMLSGSSSCPSRLSDEGGHKGRPSMRMALEDLNLDHLAVVYPGEQTYPLGDRITVLPLAALAAAPEAIYGVRKAG